ncbi:hypothetical protein [Streptomyces chartreusis]|uniref:hypothetical protein n=1 Tax=Streptomyces chartreusis TaxID=1969 RepID=UPI003444D836
MSKLRIATLFTAAGAIAAPYLGVIPQELAEEAKHWAPHSVGTMLINVFWLQLVWLIKLIGHKIGTAARHVFDAVLLFAATSVERLKKRVKRLKQEQQNQEQRRQATVDRHTPLDGQTNHANGDNAMAHQVPGPRVEAGDPREEHADGVGAE